MKKIILNFVCVYVVCILQSFNAVAQQSLWVGQKYTCESTHAGTSVLLQNVAWTITPSSLLTVSGSGLYREVTPASYFSGSVTVKMTCRYKYSWAMSYLTGNETWTITCKSNPLKITNTTMSLNTGKSAYIGTSLTYTNAYSSSVKYSFSGYDTGIISVSSDGKVTGLKPGTTTVTVSSTHSANTCTCKVSVVNPTISVTGASIPTSTVCAYNGSKQLSLTILPSDATVTSKVWTSSNTSVATINSSGLITAVSPGTSIIYCTVNGSIKSNACICTVNEPSFTMSGSSLEKISENVSINTQPSVTFSLPVYQGTEFNNISLIDSSTGECIPGTVTINNKTITFVPENPLQKSTGYNLIIPANSLKNQWGTHYAKAITIGFSTEAEDGNTTDIDVVGNTPIVKKQVIKTVYYIIKDGEKYNYFGQRIQ